MKILFTTDGSEHSESAARFLNRLRLSPLDEITILHVVSNDPFQDEGDYYYTKIREIRQMIAPNILDSARNILQLVPAKVSTMLMHGYPDECIVDAAVNSDTDIIIMGHKRLRGIQSRIVGSVTKSVSINSPKPALVIKPLRQESSSVNLKILLATDGSGNANMTAEFLTSLPFPADSEIVILHVVTPAFHGIPERFMTKLDATVTRDLNGYEPAESEKSKEILSNTTGIIQKRFLNIKTLTKSGDPADEILQTAIDLRTDIIVLGSKGMGGFKGVVGSASRYILSAADCSVLIGKRAAP
jgi:nucleotide-binding universal stress UspA family protein